MFVFVFVLFVPFIHGMMGVNCMRMEASEKERGNDVDERQRSNGAFGGKWGEGGGAEGRRGGGGAG